MGTKTRHRARMLRGVLRLSRCVGWIFALLPASLQAATYVVNTTNDDPPTFGCTPQQCGLRNAITAANIHPGFDRIVLPPGVYVLRRLDAVDPDFGGIDEDNNDTGDLDIHDTLSIEGPGAELTSIDGGGNSRLLEVLPGVTVSVSNLSLRNGHSSESGGAIQNAGTLSLRHVTISGNRAASAFVHNYGGAIDNLGSLTLSDCVLSGNLAASGEGGWGEGGAVYNSGTLTMLRSLVANNETSDDDDFGGGSGLYNLGTATLRETVWSDNRLPAASQRNGSTLLNTGSGQLTLSNSTVSGNVGGLAFGGLQGAAIANDSGARLLLSYVTVADNAGGGLSNAGTMQVVAAIVAGNPNGVEDIAEQSYYNGNNCQNSGSFSVQDSVFGADGTCPWQQTIAVDNGRVFDTVLAPLAANGGALPTHALRPTSVAIDAVSADTVCPPTDQRGAPRPRDGDGDHLSRCDAGAFERHRAVLPQR